MIGVGQPFPQFSLTAVMGNDMETAFTTVTENEFEGKWKCYFFWPKDFTFVCPTEIAGFGDLNSAFEERNTKVLGCSVDSEFVHLAWKNSDEKLKDIPFPMLSDIKRELSEGLGILDQEAGVSQRATFLVDPENVVRYVSVTDLSVGRNTDEVLRVLDALQCGGLCPVNWKKGEDTL